MLASNKIENPVEAIEIAIKNNDSTLLANAIIEIFIKYPTQYKKYLFHAGLMSNPIKMQNVDDQIQLVLDALAKITNQETEIDKQQVAIEMLKFLHKFLTFNNLFREIINKKKEVKFFSESSATRIYVLAYFLESQIRNASHFVQEQVEKTGFFSDSTMTASNINLRYSPGKVGVQAGIESTCEYIELMLRETLHLARSKGYGEINHLTKAYNSPDFESEIILAANWGKLDELWTNFRFGDWDIDTSDKDKLIVFPVKKDYMKHEATAKIRHQRILYSIASNILPSLHKNATDTQETIENLKKSLNINPSFDLWDGFIDLSLLKEASKKTTTEIMSMAIVEKRHYKQLLPTKIKQGKLETSWQSWLKAFCLLRVIALALEKKTDEFSDRKPESLVIKVNKATLVTILTSTMDIKEDEAYAVIELLTFNPKRKAIEIWDQPFLPISDKEVLFLPRLTQMGSIIRSLENIASEYGSADFSARGTPFEIYIRDTWRKIGDKNVIHDLTIATHDDGNVQFDIVVYWDSKIILCEAKCLKAVHNTADENRAWEQVDYSIQQLKRRKKTVLNNWIEFCQKASFFKLPEAPLLEPDIICISVNNLTDFTGLMIDDIIILDDVVLTRFFQNPDIEAINLQNGELIKLASIRDDISVQSFLKYIKTLPQVEDIKNCVETSWTYVAPTQNDQTRIIYPIAVYNQSPLEKKAFNQLLKDQPVENPTKKTQKIGRNSLCSCGSGRKYKKCCMR